MMKTSRMILAVVVCLAVGIFGACGGDGFGNSVSKEELPDRMAQIRCEKLFNCCTSTEREVKLSDYDSKMVCQDLYAGLTRASTVAALRRAEDKGRAEYDADAMGECLSNAESAGCGTIAGNDNPVDSCLDTIDGKVEFGETCEHDLECKEGECLEKEGASKDSVCRKLPGEGEDCISGFRCREGFYCDRGDTCEPEKEKGTSCTDENECKSGVCEGLTCGSKKPGGESCEQDSDCESNACNLSDDEDEGVCLSTPVCDGE